MSVPYHYNDKEIVTRNHAMSLLVDIEGLDQTQAHSTLIALRENAGMFWTSKKIVAGLEYMSQGSDLIYLHYDVWPVLNPRTFEIHEGDPREVGSILRPSELRLGDTVQLMSDDGPTMRSFGCSIVKQVEDDSVTLFRPYGATANFSYTGGVICYVGIDTHKVYKTPDVQMYMLLDKKKLR